MMHQRMQAVVAPFLLHAAAAGATVIIGWGAPEIRARTADEHRSAVNRPAIQQTRTLVEERSDLIACDGDALARSAGFQFSREGFRSGRCIRPRIAYEELCEGN